MNQKDEVLTITKRTQPVMFSIRVDKSIVDYYDKPAARFLPVFSFSGLACANLPVFFAFPLNFRTGNML